MAWIHKRKCYTVLCVLFGNIPSSFCVGEIDFGIFTAKLIPLIYLFHDISFEQTQTYIFLSWPRKIGAHTRQQMLAGHPTSGKVSLVCG